jgi:hypothetical protein
MPNTRIKYCMPGGEKGVVDLAMIAPAIEVDAGEDHRLLGTSSHAMVCGWYKRAIQRGTWLSD